MNQDELRRQVGAILDAEEREPADWSQVERLIAELQQQLRANPNGECPEVVWHYFSDADIRALDTVYAAKQRAAVRRFVDTGEHTDGTDVSPWTCAIVAAVAGLLLLWLLL